MNRFDGLTKDQVETSRLKYGSNELVSGQRHSFWREFLSNFGDPIIKVLLIALALNIIFTIRNFNWFESIGILVAIFISTFISTISEYGSELAFEKIQKQAANTFCRVIRDGEVSSVAVSEIVCGDIVLVSAGEKIAADGYIISGAINVDQSALNGESAHSKKYPTSARAQRDLSCQNALFRGSVVCSGEGIMKVTAVGKNTLYGELAKDLNEQTRESPLKLRLRKLATTVSNIGYIAAVVVAVCYLFNVIVIDNSFNIAIILANIKNVSYVVNTLLHALTLAVTIIVVAVPEGLPMMITVVLSANMKKMLKDRILVRKLVGIETAGSMNILFTDKTGTLTTGKQKVEHILLGDMECVKKGDRSLPIYKFISWQASLNTECNFSGKRIIGGNPTDRALAEFAGAKMDSYPKVKNKISFDSDKKFSSVVIEHSDWRSLVKGAPEIILQNVEYYLDKNMSAHKLVAKNSILNKIKEYSSKSYRVIALALSKHDSDKLYFIGLAIISDELRKGVSNSVVKMQNAGVQVVMLTGDHLQTARAIAAECKIIRSQNDLVLTSDELSKMSDDQVRSILPHLRVVARSLPADKSRLVRIAQSLELVVGMTGDGINDAPALKIADVGFAMGSGTDIAREAGDIVLLDDDFSYIATTVLYGRTIFKSIRKFIIFQLTMNFCAVAVSIIGPFIGFDTPVTVIQMLWINIIMDTLGGLAFAGEAPVETTMTETPKKRDEPLVNSYMTKQIAFCTVFTVFVCILFLKLPAIQTFFGYPESNLHFMSAFFALFIFLGIVNCFIARTPRINLTAHLSENKTFISIMLAVSLIQLCMIYFGGSVFRATPISFKQMIFVIGLSLFIVPFECGRRIILRCKYGYNCSL